MYTEKERFKWFRAGSLYEEEFRSVSFLQRRHLQQDFVIVGTVLTLSPFGESILCRRNGEDILGDLYFWIPLVDVARAIFGGNNDNHS